MGLEDPKDRAALMEALKEFQSSKVVEELIDDLKEILDAPHKRILYRYISPLIPARLRAEYKSLVPHIPGFEKKIVRIKQQGNHPIGFTVRGGKEFNIGIYVTRVEPSSKAGQNGLKPGDQIVRVNGLTLSDCTHDEFISLIKLKKSIALAVKTVGLIPGIKPDTKKISWKGVVEPRKWQSQTRIGIHGPIRSTKRIQVTIKRGESLGANVKTSAAIDGGVLIVDVVANSPTYNAGLRPGDEILDVNGRSLVGRPHDEAIAILKSSNTLMMTIRADTKSKRSSFESNATNDFEFGPQDFDVDAEILSPRGVLSEDTFMLRPREDAPTRRLKQKNSNNPSGNRISVSDTEVHQSRTAPVIASPAAFGYGPTLAMPTLLGMGEQMPNREDSVDFSGLDFSVKSAGVMGNQDDRQTSPNRTSLGSSSPVTPPQIPVPKIGRATVDGDKRKQNEIESTDGPLSPSKQDLSSFQFPVDDDENGITVGSGVTRQPSASALKKSGPTSGKGRRPTFSEDVQIIPEHRKVSSSSSREMPNTSVHPSNFKFSEEILKGRKVQFHSVPKDGPLRLAIRGGRDTPLGPQIIISRIIDGGTAASYGKLNIGDQILVCDGISLIDVTHDEAAQAFKRAMDIKSPSIDLVVAINPDAQAKTDISNSKDTNI